ncbi:neuronal growth regulator 1-like [Mytilus californianus]|uniref:neuronal growth regulator 1-like n=1 Tax=Mytilus californianus TaxID=6549 RepID=UPI0022479DD5|nr:neuronal growth regulator 1-like [Mytilus californianus]
MPYTDRCDLNPQLNETNIKIIRNDITNQCSLEIQNFSRIDEGTYICQSFKLKVHSFNVFIKRLPSNLTIATDNENRNLTVVEGKNISILCQVHGGRPKEKLTLIINDTVRGNGSKHTFTPQKSDNNASVICEASSYIMEFPLVKKTRLDVHFKPSGVCKLEPKHLIEERNAKLCCVVESNPQSSFTWTMASDEILRLNKTNENCLVWSPINRKHDGRYYFLAENYLGSFNSTIKIQVVYPPQVTVAYNLTNGTLNFECSPSGVPNNFTFTQLEHRSEFDEHIRFLNSPNDYSVLRISIGNAGLQDIGIYICKVSNGVPDQKGRKFQSGKTVVFELEGKLIELHID